MSNIGIAANLFQPSGKCLKCRHWNPATKDFMGNGTDGHCRLAYCKNSRPERRRKMIKLENVVLASPEQNVSRSVNNNSGDGG